MFVWQILQILSSRQMGSLGREQQEGGAQYVAVDGLTIKGEGFYVIVEK